MLNEWFEFEAYRVVKGEDTLVLELHQVRLLRTLANWKAGESFEWITIDLFGGKATIRERKDRIVDHPMKARFGIAREWESALSTWNKRKGPKRYDP